MYTCILAMTMPQSPAGGLRGLSNSASLLLGTDGGSARRVPGAAGRCRSPWLHG